MDGPAHLYNSRLIYELFFGGTESVRTFYDLTEIPVPNWLGHLMLAASLTVLPAFLAEKVVLLTYLVGLPYAFRWLIKVISPYNIEYSFFILPFCYSYLFTLGFYNYSLALILMFLALAAWISSDHTGHTQRIQFGLAGLLILLYFAHIFVFGLTLIMLALYIVIGSITRGRIDLNAMFRSAWPGVVRLTFASFVPVLLALNYYWHMPEASAYTFVSMNELLEWVHTLRPIISYNIELECVHTRRIVHVLAILLMGSLSIFLANSIRSHPAAAKPVRSDRNSIYFWWIMCLVFLVLYLVLPDGNGAAGYMTVRLGLMFFMIFIAALSLHRMPKLVTWAAIVFVLFSHLALSRYYISVVREQNRIAMNCEAAGEYLRAGSIIYPFDRSGNWLGRHYSNYLGVNTPVVILENYEAGLGYFPLKWNEEQVPGLWMGKMRVAELISEPWAQNDQPRQEVDHIFILGKYQDLANDTTDCFLKDALKRYTLIYSNENCTLLGLINSDLGNAAKGR